MTPKTVIVTGAASGIGLACAEALLAEGHRVAACDLAALPAMLGRGVPDGRFLGIETDVAAPESCARTVAEAASALGPVAALCHFAGAHDTRTWDELGAEDFDRTLRVNVTGSFLMSQAVARHMADHGGGAIVLTGSGSINVSGMGGHGRGGPAYVSSKAAIIGLTRALARSLGPLGIRVNAVSPGATDTAMTADYDEEARAKVAARTILGRMGRPGEIAQVAMFLISDAAAYITGEVVQVNGGGSFS